MGVGAGVSYPVDPEVGEYVDVSRAVGPAVGWDVSMPRPEPSVSAGAGVPNPPGDFSPVGDMVPSSRDPSTALVDGFAELGPSVGCGGCVSRPVGIVTPSMVGEEVSELVGIIMLSAVGAAVPSPRDPSVVDGAGVSDPVTGIIIMPSVGAAVSISLETSVTVGAGVSRSIESSTAVGDEVSM